MYKKLNLKKLFLNLKDELYVIVKYTGIDEYKPGSDIDIFVLDSKNFVAKILDFGFQYLDLGYEIEVIDNQNKHSYVDFKRENKIELRFDLYEDFEMYKNISIKNEYFQKIFESRQQLLNFSELQNFYVYVLKEKDELVFRYLEFIDWFAERPDKIKHLSYILKSLKSDETNFEFINLLAENTTAYLPDMIDLRCWVKEQDVDSFSSFIKNNHWRNIKNKIDYLISLDKNSSTLPIETATMLIENNSIVELKPYLEMIENHSSIHPKLKDVYENFLLSYSSDDDKFNKLSDKNNISTSEFSQPIVRNELISFDNSALKNTETISIIFSKDRPFQLDALLRSYFLHCQDWKTYNVVILYNTSSNYYKKLYEQLIETYSEFNNIKFHFEQDFKSDLINAIEGTDFYLFLVDDAIFVNEFSIKNIIEQLQKRNSLIGFSLRLGTNTSYCYSLDKPQKLPSFDIIDENYMIYNWTKEECDFNYPLEISSSIFRAQDLLPILTLASYANPNTLESMLDSLKHLFEKYRPNLMCHIKSTAFCMPVNRVQSIYENRTGNNCELTPEKLAQFFESGKRVDVLSYNGFVPNACHQEIDFKIIDKTHIHKSDQIMSLVSVIIPCYNQAQYLRESIESLVNQTYINWECIIVNDGSNDNTYDVSNSIIEKYSQFRIKLYNQTNSGLADARNMGIAQSSGKLILPLDADDKLDPFALEEMVHLLLDPSIDLVYSDYHTFELTSEFIHCISESEFYQPTRNENGLAYCSMYRRTLWEKVNGYNTNMLWGYEDWDFWLGCLEKKAKVKKLKKAVFLYRVRESSMLSNAIKYDILLRMQMILNHQTLYTPKVIYDAKKKFSKNPLVSVILPTFNRRKQLQIAIESVLNQSFSNFEIIVVNDAGEDVSDIINSFSDPRIKYFKHQKNKGLAAARNSGINNSTGKYIAYLDDDDAYYPMHLITLVRFLENNNIKVAYTDAYKLNQILINNDYVTIGKELSYSHSFDYKKMLVGNYIPVLCIMHERKCLEKTGLFDESLLSHEDWDLWIRMGNYYEFHHIVKNTCEYTWRDDGSSMTSSCRDNMLITLKRIYKKSSEMVGSDERIKTQRQSYLMNYEKEVLETLQKPLLTANQVMNILNNAESLIEQKNYNEAKKLLHKILNIDPKNILALNNLSVVHILENQSEIASDLIQKILEMEPENEVAIGNQEYLAQIDFAEINKNNLLQSSSLLYKGEEYKEINIKPDSLQLHQMIIDAEELIEKSELEQARLILNEILKFDFHHTEALNNLAVVDILENNYQSALNSIKLVLEINSDNEVANGNLEYLLDLVNCDRKLEYKEG